MKAYFSNWPASSVGKAAVLIIMFGLRVVGSNLGVSGRHFFIFLKIDFSYF